MSEIDSGQILDGTIVNADIAANAAIDTTKLAEGALFAKTSDVNTLIAGLQAQITTLQTQHTTQQTQIDGIPSKFVCNDEATGTIDGVNKVFTIAYAPIEGKLWLFRSLLQTLNVDYTITGNTITFTNAPTAGPKIVAFYIRP